MRGANCRNGLIALRHAGLPRLEIKVSTQQYIRNKEKTLEDSMYQTTSYLWFRVSNSSCMGITPMLLI